jgi:hypothetical protein
MRYNPLSSHRDNYMDLLMGIQENKNQHNGDALPIQLLRLMRAIRDKKGRAIWRYFEAKVATASTDSASLSDDNASTTSSVSSDSSAPVLRAAVGSGRAVPAAATGGARAVPTPDPVPSSELADTITLSPPPISSSPPVGIPGEELIRALSAFLSRIDPTKTYGPEHAPLLTLLRNL